MRSEKSTSMKVLRSIQSIHICLLLLLWFQALNYSFIIFEDNGRWFRRWNVYNKKIRKQIENTPSSRGPKGKKILNLVILMYLHSVSFLRIERFPQVRSWPAFCGSYHRLKLEDQDCQYCILTKNVFWGGFRNQSSSWMQHCVLLELEQCF